MLQRSSCRPRENSSGHQNFCGPDVHPAADTHLFRVQGVLMNFHPILPRNLQIREEVRGSNAIRGQNSLQQSWHRGFAEVFAILLSLGVEIVIRGAGRLPLHLLRYVVREAVRKAERGVGERQIQLVLLHEQLQLLCFDGVRRFYLNSPSSVKGGSESHAVDRLGKLNRAVEQGDVLAIADDFDVFCVRGLGGIHRRRGQGFPYTGCGRRGGGLRATAGREKYCKNDREGSTADHKAVSWFPARKYIVFASQASAA